MKTFLVLGKTSIVRRLLTESTFDEQHVPTVEELYQIEYKIRNSDVTLMLDLLDTSGTYPFPGKICKSNLQVIIIFLVAMRDLAIRNADAFILVYAVDDQDSLDEVCRLKEHITEMRGASVPPIVVVANKCGKQFPPPMGKINVTNPNLVADLVNTRVIDTNLIDSVISIDWEYGHVECSAKTNNNLYKIFTQLLRQKIQMEKHEKDLERQEFSDSDISPSRSSVCSEKLFFAEDFHGSNNSLNIDSRKSSMTDSELEFRLRNGFKNSNCIIS